MAVKGKRVRVTSPKEGDDPGAILALGGLGLLTSIIGNIAQADTNKALKQNLEAARRMVQDTQTAYQQLDAQLALALSANQELTQQNRSMRDQLRQTQARVYEAERRLVEAEAALAKARAEVAKGSEPKNSGGGANT